jgi:hypothetical protein
VKSFSGLYDKQVITYSGEFVDKYIEEYPCGKHKRNTCNRYVVETTDSVLNVSYNAYNRATKLFPFVTYKTVLDRPAYATFFMWLWFPAMFSYFMIGPISKEED